MTRVRFSREHLPIPFSREPLAVSDEGVPIFCSKDRYVSNYDEIAKAHLKSVDENGSNPFMSAQTWTAVDSSTTNILKRFVKRGDTLFDAGVGLGALLEKFPDNPRYGIDVSLDYLHRSARKGIHVAMALLEDIPFQDSSFDLVLSTDVLEHVLDFYNATRQIVRILKPGGHLVVRVPLEEDMRAYYNYRDFDFVHLRRFDLWSLRLHFERVLGLEYILDQPVLPLYRGVSTCRMRPAANGEVLQEVLGNLPEDIAYLSAVKAFAELSPSSFEEFMNSVSIKAPMVFEELVSLIAGYLEINVVFRKPHI